VRNCRGGGYADVCGERGRRLHLVLFALLLLATACGQAPAAPPSETVRTPPSTPTPAVPPTATAGGAAEPSLECHGKRLVLGAADVNGASLTCTVVGAGAAETSFELVATLRGAEEDAVQQNLLCSGPLRGGAGRCSGTAMANDRFWGGGPTVSGTLRPSGRQVGPAAVSLEP